MIKIVFVYILLVLLVILVGLDLYCSVSLRDALLRVDRNMLRIARLEGAEQMPGPPPPRADMSDMPGMHGASDASDMSSMHAGRADRPERADKAKRRYRGMEEFFDGEYIKRLVEMVKESHPELVGIAKEDRFIEEFVRKKILRQWSRMRLLVEVYKKDPEFARKLIEDSLLEYRIDLLVDRYNRATSAEDKERIKSQIKALLSDQFDVRQWIRQRRLDGLEKQIRELEEELKRRNESREKLIQKRLNELLSESEEVGW